MRHAATVAPVATVEWATELPMCDHCAEPVVAVVSSSAWTWRHAEGHFRCLASGSAYAMVNGSHAVDHRSLTTTDD